MRWYYPPPETSRVALFEGAGFRVETRAVPECGEGDVLVRFLAGSLAPADLDPRRRQSGILRTTTAAEIVALGDRVRSWDLADRVVVFWGGLPPGSAPPPGLAEYMRVPAAWLKGPHAWKPPLEAPADLAAALPPFAVAARAWREAKPRKDASLAFLGLSPAVQATLQWTRHQSAGTLIAVDGSSTRRERARWAGADPVLDPAAAPVRDAVRAATQGRGVDAAFVGDADTRTLADALSVLAPGGTLVVLDDDGGAGAIALPPLALWRGEVRVLGVRRPDAAAWRDAWKAHRARHVDPETLVSRRVRWSDLGAFAWDDEARRHALLLAVEGPEREILAAGTR